MPPLVSVVIPNHNYGRFLAEAIESALRQTYPHVELLVVDDGSTDESREVLRRYARRLRWISQPRQGVSAARNRGVRESRGELVAFLDSDDAWRPETLARQVARLDRPAVGMVCCGLEYIDESGRVLGQSLPTQRGRLLREIALLRWSYAPGGSAALVRRSSLQRAGLFDEALSTSADWDLWRRIAAHDEIEICPEPLVQYRVHAGSMHTDLAVFERDMLRAFAKMFQDPAAAAVHGLRRRSYSNLYRQFSGSNVRAGRWGKSVAYAWRSVLAWPPSAVTLGAVPIRRLRRRLGRRPEALEPACSP